MKKEHANRIRPIGLRLTAEEYAIIEKKWKASTCRKLSDYARRQLFEKPVVTTFRNRSQDDLIEELTRLRTELNAIGNNLNQVIKKMHGIRQLSGLETWSVEYHVAAKTIENKLDEIRQNIQKQVAIWLQ